MTGGPLVDPKSLDAHVNDQLVRSHLSLGGFTHRIPAVSQRFVTGRPYGLIHAGEGRAAASGVSQSFITMALTGSLPLS